MKKKKLAIFVHDFVREVGHSHALIETIKNMSGIDVEELRVIAFRSCDLYEEFEKFSGKKKFIRVPLAGLYPFYFKTMFFHVYSFVYATFFLSKDFLKVGVGIATLCSDVVNIQFVHQHWESYYFKLHSLKGFRWAYKKILFVTFRWMENFLYRRPSVKLSVLSEFETKYCRDQFGASEQRCRTVYSGINLEKYRYHDIPRQDLFAQLAEKYPQLKNIDSTVPIFLFVGAFERKGIVLAMEKVQKIGGQLLIIGSPESHHKFEFLPGLKYCHIQFSKELPLFYSLCDNFIFPTIYEPFGLVIIEAVAMGMRVYTTQERVGATELLKGLDGVHIFLNAEAIELDPLPILTPEMRKAFIVERVKVLKNYSWRQAGEQFAALCFNK